MRAAVVDDPDHLPGAGVRLGAHHLVDEPPERLDPGPGLTVPEHLRPMDVPGGEIGERTAPLVLVLDAPPARSTVPKRNAAPSRMVPWRGGGCTVSRNGRR